MIKKNVVIDLNKIDINMLSLLTELEEKGFIKDGYLVYEKSDSDFLNKIFAKYNMVL